MSKQLYDCDPNKNKQCNKRSCKFNSNAKYPVCDKTSHKEFAIDENGCPRSK